MALSFGQIPTSAIGHIEPFTLHHPENELSQLETLLNLSRVGPETWWNQQADGKYGISRDWLIESKDVWLNDFDWRQQEAKVNAFPNFKVNVTDTEHGELQMHFIGLFSTKQDATPLLFMHGWPGSVLEFLPTLDILSTKYSPTTLPYHVIVPSIPGYGYSSSISPANELTLNGAARIVNQLMIELGFGSGYVAQGGDVGAMLSSLLLRDYDECKAAHINLFASSSLDPSDPVLTAADVERLEWIADFQPTGMSYAGQQGTRPATTGHVVGSNPLGLLAWIGEKIREWAGEPIPLEHLLADVTLYWLTASYPSGLYPYTFTLANDPFDTSKEKPLGYSNFPDEILFLPQGVAERDYPNIIQYTTPAKGGHFAAWEVPQLLLDDVESFVAKVADLI